MSVGRIRRWALYGVLAWGCWTGLRVHAAAPTSESEAAFLRASRVFQDGLWDRAERELQRWTEQFPESPRGAEGVLLLAQARFQLRRYADVVGLLEMRLASAGALADQYRYWLAEAYGQDRKWPQAIAVYVALLELHPESPLRLEASYGEAYARFRQGEFGTVSELLQKPEGHFVKAAQANPDHPLALRGPLLLAEALKEQQLYRAAQDVLGRLDKRTLPTEVKWEQQRLLTVVEWADQQIDRALTRASNLVELAAVSGQVALHANALRLQGELLEKVRPEAAVDVYERLAQVQGLSSEQSREGLLKSVDLSVRQGRLADAIARLSHYLQGRTNGIADSSLDLARLTLGDLYLKQFRGETNAEVVGVGSVGITSNVLTRARQQYETVIQTATNRPFVLGKAYLSQGWCLWEDVKRSGGTSNLIECQTAFRAAAERLPQSEDQAVSVLKVAECEFQLGQWTNALRMSQQLLQDYDKATDVKSKLFDQVLYLMVRVSIAAGKPSAAQEALNRILTEFPGSPLGAECLLLMGEAWLEAGRLAEARQAFDELPKRFPQSPLRPEAERGLARSYAQEGQWSAALEAYDRWVQTYTNHPALTQTEYDRALALARSGNEPSALQSFTQFVARYGQDRLAPLAQYWIGDYHLSLGRFEDAQASYENRLLAQNTNAPSPWLGLQARMMAARAAFLRQGYPDARRNVTNVINELLLSNTNAPATLAAEAFYFYGEIILAEPATTAAGGAFDRYSEAIKVFSRATNDVTLKALAHGRLGDCYLQRSSLHPPDLDLAAREYELAWSSPGASVTTRSQAETGWATVLEMQGQDPARSEADRLALREQALDRYLNVVYGKGLRAAEAEQPDFYWLSRAAQRAGALAEQCGRIRDAIGIYQRLGRTLPVLRAVCDRKIEALKAREPTAATP